MNYNYNPVLADDMAFAINCVNEAIGMLNDWEGLDELGRTEAEVWRTQSIEYARITITHIRKAMHSSGVPWDRVLEMTGGRR